MTQDIINKLTDKLKDNYNNLIDSDEEVKLEEILELFNIPFDSSRKEDYTIDLIDPEKISIELTDNKNNLKYISKFSNTINMSKSCVGGRIYINLQIIGPTYTILKDYLIKKNNPITERLIITQGEYILEFIKKNPYCDIMSYKSETICFDIDYSILDNKYGYIEKNRLLTKSYEEYNINGDIKISHEKFDNTTNHYIGDITTQEKHIYTRDNSIVYGINKLDHSYHNHTKGFFIENTSKSNYYQSPQGMYKEDYRGLFDADVKSAVIANGYGKGNYNFIELYKKNKTAKIQYSRFVPSEIRNAPATKQYTEQEIPLLSEGPITSSEIKIIIESLKEKYPNDTFIDIINDELLTFGNILDRRKVSNKEALLTPQMYYDKKMEDIVDIVIDNQEELFKLVKEQFDKSKETEKYTSGLEILKEFQKKKQQKKRNN